jgi:hypothetical protein
VLLVLLLLLEKGEEKALLLMPAGVVTPVEPGVQHAAERSANNPGDRGQRLAAPSLLTHITPIGDIVVEWGLEACTGSFDADDPLKVRDAACTQSRTNTPDAAQTIPPRQ